MRKIAFIFVFVGNAYLTFAQLSGQDAFFNTLNLGGQSNIIRTWDNRYQGIKGHPFVKNSWESARVVSVDGKVYSDVPLKYDVYSNLIVIKNSKGDSLITEVFNFQEFTWKNTQVTFVKEPLLDAKNPKNYGKLYEQLFKGNKITLLKNHRKILLQADYQGGYNANRRYDELVDEYDYFLKKNNTSIEKIKLNEKSLLKALADKEKALKDFLKKEKLNLKTEPGVIRLLQYYDSL